MFSLIISIIAIALVVMLAGASLYYGGESFSDNSSRSSAARYMNEASQISGSITVYKSDNGGVPDDFALADLVPHYLVELPAGDWAVSGDNIVRTGISGLECFRVNEESTSVPTYTAADSDVTEVDTDKFVPNCDKPDLTTETVCCFTP